MARLSPLQRKAETDLLAGEDAHAVQGLARGLSVLRAFRPGEGALSNAEIAARTGLSRPTVSRLTQTLTALGYLAYVPRLGRYTLGAAIASLCHSLLSGMPYRIAAQPFLREVAETTRLPVSLGARDNLHMINIDTVRHDNAPPARFDLGARIPLATTAMGRAYLFALPTAERSGLLDRIRRDAGRDWRAIRRRHRRRLRDAQAPRLLYLGGRVARRCGRRRGAGRHCRWRGAGRELRRAALRDFRGAGDDRRRPADCACRGKHCGEFGWNGAPLGGAMKREVGK